MLYPFDTIRELNESEINKADDLFDEIFGYPEKEEEVWTALYPLMTKLTSDQLFQYQTTYTKWFAQLGWFRYRTLSHPEFFEIIEKVSGVGVLQGEDIWKNVVTYLHLRSVSEEDMMEMYEKIKKTFLTSNEMLYTDNGTMYRMTDLIKDIEKVNETNDALVPAELFTKLGSYFSVRVQQMGFGTELDDIFAYFKSIINFFLGVEKGAIYALVESVFYSEQYEQLEQGTLDKISSADINNNPTMDIAKNPAVEEDQNVGSMYKEIKEKIEHDFSYNIEDQLEPIEDVLGRLAEYAQEYGDSKIEELYYFDEQQEKFVWNDELINSQ